MIRTTIISILLQRSSPSAPPSIPKTPILSLISSANPFSSRRKRDDENSDSSFILNRDPERPPKLLVVQPRLRPDSLLRSKLSEALNLANSLEEQRDGSHASMKNPPHLVVQNPSLRSLKADVYFGPGTVDNIKCHLKALESKDEVVAVFVNTILSGIQQRNLEMAWGKPVLDRVGLIIEIFNAHAETKEAKLQSELAALMYKRSRLVRVRGPGGRLTFGTSGEAEVVSARGRGSGGRGFISGAGETELQLQRRRIQERQKYLLSQIEEVRRTRAIQRSSRRRHGSSDGLGLSTVAVVGYTNAGKSTLVSALSGTDVYCDDRLFATVDPRLRHTILPSGKKTLLSDTVGFISDLPIQLVEAFHATLEEVVEADLLVHVLDASAPDLDEQRATVLEVLQQIGVAEEKMQNMIEVWNKIDLIDKNTGVDGSLERNEWLEDESVVEEELLSGDKEGHDETISRDECFCQSEEEKDIYISTEECIIGGEEEMDETVSEIEDGFTSNPDEHGMVSVLPSEEYLENADDQEIVSSEQKGTTNVELLSHSAKGNQPIRTSAVLGIGLQELLNVIDKKLSAPKSIVTRSFGPFDRKWRPSYSTENNEKVASQ